jgi:hypothetical protein
MSGSVAFEKIFASIPAEKSRMSYYDSAGDIENHTLLFHISGVPWAVCICSDAKATVFTNEVVLIPSKGLFAWLML